MRVFFLVFHLNQVQGYTNQQWLAFFKKEALECLSRFDVGHLFRAILKY